MDQATQFSFRRLLVVMSTCGMAFAVLAYSPHEYITVAVLGIPIFWLGSTCVLVGGVLELQGDRWLLPSILVGVSGVIVCVISVFTSLFYTVLIAVVTVATMIT